MKFPAPRLEIDLDKIEHNARLLVERLGSRAIRVCGITKATLGTASVAKAMQMGGVASLGDSRIGNIRDMHRAGIKGPFLLTRAPMLSEVNVVVRYASASLNSELVVIRALSVAAVAQRRRHEIVLMVEMGDLREGLMPEDLLQIARAVTALPGLALSGIGCNLACYGGISPDAGKMQELSEHATRIESALNISLNIVSGGNSANLEWAFGSHPRGRINQLRLGEAILLGCETLGRRPIPGLHADAFVLVAEIIESRIKPGLPWGRVAQSAFGIPPAPDLATGKRNRAILAIGRQDCDPEGLTPPAGIRILGASSDHLIVESRDAPLAVGDELRFTPNYSALLRSMTSRYVTQVTSR